MYSQFMMHSQKNIKQNVTVHGPENSNLLSVRM